jgi:hypothetical protein
MLNLFSAFFVSMFQALCLSFPISGCSLFMHLSAYFSVLILADLADNHAHVKILQHMQWFMGLRVSRWFFACCLSPVDSSIEIIDMLCSVFSQDF